MTAHKSKYTTVNYGSSQSLVQNGYLPIPISTPSKSDPAAGKKPPPGYPDWAEWSAEKHRQFTTGFNRSAFQNCGVGLLCSSTPGCDIDVRNEAIATALEDLARRMLGDSPLIRIGQAPKRLLVYRAETPFPKLKTSVFRFPDEPPIGPEHKGHAVEILADGQQFVAFGQHPTTRKPYYWTGDGTPATISAARLPLITQASAQAFIVAADEYMLSMNMMRAVPPRRIRNGTIRNDQTPIDDIKSALDFVPNDDCHYDDWVAIGMAIKAALGPAGAPVFAEWSERSAKNDPAATAKAFDTFAPTEIGTGTLFYLAKQYGWQLPRNAMTPDGVATPLPPRVKVRLTLGDEGFATDDCEQALISYGVEVYQRGGELVVPDQSDAKNFEGKTTHTPVIRQMTQPRMRYALAKTIVFERFDRRIAGGGAWTTTNCPAEIPAMLIAKSNWRVSILTGIINAPTLRHDGSLLTQPGYDEQTGLLFEDRGVKFLPVADKPTLQDAQSAIATLKHLLCGFPFVDPSLDQAVALSGILTALVRQTIEVAPIHAYTAPVAGSGKSKLVDLAAALALGSRAPIISQGQNEEEMEKRLGTALLQGDPILSIDNCEQPLGGVLLCQMATEPNLSIRRLGSSELVRVPNVSAVYATGNRLTIRGDAVRRVLLCSIDPQHPRPETRRFEIDCVDEALASRPKYVHAALTILRAYAASGTIVDPTPFGSYAYWSKRVRCALIWAGERDVCDTVETVRATDPKLRALNDLMREWDLILGNRPVLVREVIDLSLEKAGQDAEGMWVPKYAALTDAIQVLLGKTVSVPRLSGWLNSVAGRFVSVPAENGGERIMTLSPLAEKGVALRWVLKGARDHTAAPPAAAPPKRVRKF